MIVRGADWQFDGKRSWRSLWREVNDDQIANGAAALAFYMVLSLFPCAIFGLSALPYLPIANLQQATTDLVREVLPNGHLVIAGEKQIGVNNNVDVLRFSGQVDPRSIQPGNTVPSAQIANVRLEQRGRGAQAEAQAIGWLARVFLSVLPI